MPRYLKAESGSGYEPGTEQLATVYSLVLPEKLPWLESSSRLETNKHHQTNRDRYGNDLLDLWSVTRPQQTAYPAGLRNRSLYGFLNRPSNIPDDRQLIALCLNPDFAYVARLNEDLPFYNSSWEQVEAVLSLAYSPEEVDELIDLPRKWPNQRNCFETSAIGWWPEEARRLTLDYFDEAFYEYAASFTGLDDFLARGPKDPEGNWEVIIPYEGLAAAGRVQAA